MKNTSKTLLFFGNERLSTGFSPRGAPTLQALLDAGYQIKAIIAHHGQTASRTKRELEIEAVAKAHKIPVLLPEQPTDITEQLATFQADAAVLVAYGKILPQSIINIFPRGIINLHPSLLPLYRGPTPIEQSIRTGAEKTGVSLMKLTDKMDSGPIYAQQEVTIGRLETKHELTERLLQIGSQLLIKHLPGILDGSLATTPQDEAKASFTPLLNKADSWLDFKKPADALEREIRTFAGWPKSKLTINGNHIIVLKARVVTGKSQAKFILECGQESLLEIIELVAPSGKTVSGIDFLRGY